MLTCLLRRWDKLKQHKAIVFVEPHKQVRCRENTPGDSCFLLSKGRVKVSTKGKVLRTLDSGSCFGENVLLLNVLINCTATVSSVECVICYELSKK